MSVSPAVFLDGVDRLYTIPHVAVRVCEMANDDRHSALDIAHEISKDPHLTAQVLRLANSAFYSFPARIDTLTRAIMVIGMQDLCNLAVTLGCIASAQQKAPESINIDDFWKHSLYTGFLARVLGSLTPVRVLHRERLFVAGVLHDIGQLAMAYKIPELMSVMVQRANRMVEPFYVTQRVIFDLDYAEVGAELLKRWNIPQALQQIVRFQNAPELAPSQSIEAALVHIANHYACGTGFPSVGLENEENINPFVWKITGLSDAVVRGAIDLAMRDYNSNLSFFLPERKSAKQARR